MFNDELLRTVRLGLVMFGHRYLELLSRISDNGPGSPGR
ncbi:hypothetical protein SAMN05216553_12135 [Lentzea fradiae]|uniref:Uncharacterized protein n=1 Tax=Lentzea fradiae TaxID=200378 RepID=A0A1G8C6M7_9PSEU|nr:hypothetical protein SAMN05216553_12135 [Lentzea fradiae]